MFLGTVLLETKRSKMSVLNQSGEEVVECPLCLEPLEVDDLNFFPCTCGYQICRFCWHRIRTDENGLCPACRKAYSENPADFKPLSQEEISRLKAEKRLKDQQRKQKIAENRKHLANIRVLQKNLVFVVGLPMRLAESEVLKKHEYFGKFGKIQKVVINQSTSYAGSQGPSASAYVTYTKADDALRAIQAVNNICVDGRTIKTSLGTTKYCSNFMKNQPCLKHDCMYLHELGDPDGSFTKEDMQQGKHQEYEKKLHEQLLASYNRERKLTPSPPAVSGQGENNVSQGNQSCSKESWPSLQPGLDSATFGLSNGTGNANNSIPMKAEISQRKQKIDQQTTTKLKNQKKNTSWEECKWKSKEGNIVQTGKSLDDLPLDETTPHPSEFVFSGDAEVQETNKGDCGGQQHANRIMINSSTSTLFEPDNNSFFSTNNFSKVSTTTGSGTTDWLPLTHMPDVLPPVHSSEDWQAAFGFTNSAYPISEQEGNSVMSDKDLRRMLMERYELPSKTSCDSVDVESSDREQAQGNNSPFFEQVLPYPIQVSNIGEEVRRSDGYLPENMAMISVIKIAESHVILNPPSSLNSADNGQHSFGQSNFVHDPALIMLPPESHVNLSSHIGGPQHPISNGLMPFQARNTVFTDSNFRQPPQHHNHSTVFESSSGQDKCFANNSSEFQNGSHSFECSLKDKYHSNFLNDQHEPQGDLEFRMFSPTIVDGGRLTDDELGFDPFHETQKALAEMMENESTVLNQQPSCYMFQNHVNQLSNSFSSQGQHIQHQNNRLLPSISSCTKLLKGLEIGPSSVTAARNRLPPPGFTTAPNHMNSFGLGIPRAPSNSSSKILPFMGLGNSSSCSPPPVTGVLFPPNNTFGLENTNSETLPMNEWPENYQPLLNGQNTSTPPTPASMHGTTQNGWNTTDWTAMDPVVSRSCPPSFMPVPHSANLGLGPVAQIEQSNIDPGQLYTNSPIAPPQRSFLSASANNQNPGFTADTGETEKADNETKGESDTTEEALR